jgi:hypothetical protein
MPAFILAIFLSAFLLFQVQPIIARYILPWYGGSPAVWTTCMLFFQIGLLIGYTYAHLLVSRFRKRPRWQAGIHLSLLVISLLMLPITPPDALKPTGAEASPVGGILLLLARTVGLPYVVIAASGPLLQHWFGSVAKGKSPYRLYAISNLGSLLGLLTYPFLFEPHLRLGDQTKLWSGGYLIYVLLAGLCACVFLKVRPAAVDADNPISESTPEASPARAPWLNRFLWVALAACGSLILLATTNQMCQDVAVVPFLWVLPLSLYLITFIIAFDHARWYYRPIWIPLGLISIKAVIYLMHEDYADTEMHLLKQITIYSSAVFCCCMVCHGEMVRLKPDPRYLTGFYLAVALGGALGGATVSLVAPQLFSGYWEFHAGLVIVVLLGGFCLLRDTLRSDSQNRKVLIALVVVAWAAVIANFSTSLIGHIGYVKDESIRSTRSFYGVLHVYEGNVDTEDHYRVLYHGRINHGRQNWDEEYRRTPGGYYTALSGPGVLFTTHPYRADPRDSRPLKYGVIGLGIGTLAAYAEEGDVVRMYEINPQIEDIALNQFTYLADSPSEEKIMLGDARIVLEQELVQGENQQFDILFVDAFSGDSIPIHLLTREAFEVYFKHLKEDGILAVHITNLHLDLSDPVRTLAKEFGMANVQIEHDPVLGNANYSRWIMITNNQTVLRNIREGNFHTPWASESFREILWTDDYSNLFQVIDWD